MHLTTKIIVLVVFVLGAIHVTTAVALDLQDGDPTRGMQVYKKCASCHMVGADARNRVGPVLNNIMSAKAAHIADYKYSKAMKKAAADGLHWNLETLNAYLENPKGYIPKTKMSFRGLKDGADRADVIAYLQTFSGGNLAAQVDEGFSVSDEVLAIVGDYEYGEYLSSECTTCHQSSGTNDGIPNITSWETEDFVTAMHAYKEKHRENPVMQLVAGRLSNEEIAALAEYFNKLNQEN